MSALQPAETKLVRASINGNSCHESASPQNGARALLGWWGRDESLAALLGRRPLAADDVRGHEITWADCCKVVAARAPFDRHKNDVIATPAPDQVAYFAQDLFKRTDVSPEDRIEWLDIGALICIQKAVDLGSIFHRGALALTDAESIWTICMPPLAPASFGCEQRENSVTFMSDNPNLRLLGPIATKHRDQVARAMAGGGETAHERPLAGELAGFRVGFGSRLTRVASVDGRYLLVNGYHRCNALLGAGVAYAPFLVSEIRSTSEIVPKRAGFFSSEIVLGPRPPFVRDYLDASVTALIKRRRIIKKVVRIIAEEFSIYEDSEGAPPGHE